MAEGAKYIKIAKKDKNGVDQSNTLASLEKITIPYSTGNITYKVLTKDEKPTFFLYEVDYAGVEWDDRAEIKYDFSSSVDLFNSNYVAGGLSPLTNLSIPISLENVKNDNLNFYNSTTKRYVVLTYLQKDTSIDFSGSLLVKHPSALGANSSVQMGIKLVRKDGSFLPLPTSTSIPSSIGTIPSGVSYTASFHLSMSYGDSPTTSTHVQSLPGDQIYLEFSSLQLPFGQMTASFTSDTFFRISSSNATGPSFETTPEPYLAGNDFSRALDCQPLLNNVDRNRRHNLYQDIDYSAGLTEPVNFDLLISGSALRAEVQLSNYTTRRHIIPRYEGSKSTSQKLNTWSKGDKGTYGKTPTAESLKRMVIYTNEETFGISGWPPERMNASTVAIRYLIDENGDVKIPNTSENSLEDVQGTFQTGERVLISSKKPGSGEASAYRRIIRGGARIEPILYTQSGSLPNVYWETGNGVIQFDNIDPTNPGSFTNVEGRYNKSDTQAFSLSITNAQNAVEFSSTVLGTNLSTFAGIDSSVYTVTSAVVNEGLDLIIGTKIIFKQINQDPTDSVDIGVFIKKVDSSGNNEEILYAKNYLEGISNSTYTIYAPKIGDNFDTIESFSNGTGTGQGFITIPSTNLEVGDKIFISVGSSLGGSDTYTVFPNSKFIVQQNPTSLPSINIPSPFNRNQLWGFYHENNTRNVITSSNAGLIQSFENLKIKQRHLTGSGFNTVALPFTIEKGDEFRFEGDERFTFMVGKVYGPSTNGNGRLTQTGSIEVHLSSPLPISASLNDEFNLDHFLIRRYVDDASQVIIEGFRPIGSERPHIVSPEFSVSKLNKGIDEYITILTEKNLLS